LRAWGASLLFVGFGFFAIVFFACASCGGGDDSGSSLGNASRGSEAGAGDGSSSSTIDGSAIGASDSGTRPPSGAYVINETFNAMTTGAAPASPWTIAASPAGSVAVQEIPFPADKSVVISKPDATGTSSLGVAFSAESGRVVFEAKVKAAETAGFKAIPYIYDSAGDAVASVAFQDGNIQAHIGGTTTIIQPFVANAWYRVRVVVDTTAGLFDLYVDGVRKEQGVALRTASGSVDHLSYFMDGTNTGTLTVDNVKVYTEAGYIGAPPSPTFDAKDFGAKGDGTTNDTAAIQAAVAKAAGTNGSVVLRGGTFSSGTITLASHMTFFIDSSAVLLGSANAADYPTQTPATGNTQLSNCQRALLYVPNADSVWIDGGGVIDGQGDSFTGVEGTRPMLIW
ncbi:MAG: glycosyl hydrolase family 28-related protein, partial [Polyangiaceae bacterium]